MFEKFLDKFDSIWEAMFFVAVSIITFSMIVLLLQYSFSKREFDGYYLNHREGAYKIYINWDNAPDEVAFKTFDGKEALRVLKELQQQSKVK